MHWAVLNNHVACVQALVEVPEERGGGLPLLKVSRNTRCFLRSSSNAIDEIPYQWMGMAGR